MHNSWGSSSIFSYKPAALLASPRVPTQHRADVVCHAAAQEGHFAVEVMGVLVVVLPVAASTTIGLAPTPATICSAKFVSRLGTWRLHDGTEICS
jgi:hypothetical protein